MKISKKWINNYINIEVSDAELVERLNLSGTEVENVATTIDEHIIVSQIKKISNHPNADRLKLVDVDLKGKTISLVCGAPNIREGQIVPLALPGAKVGDIVIQKTTIRDVESNGMLCSEKELGLGEDDSGILILNENYQVGETLNTYVQSDTVFELEITPNRGDCLSHIGMAREISAITKGKIKKEPISLSMISENISSLLKVEVENPRDCPYYFARYVKDVQIGPSPEWLQIALKSIGLTPINNIVDITNYIMMDLGQPLHAFDASKIKSRSIIVRRAKPNEKIGLLDGRNLELTHSDLVIADQKGPIALAGIMGGSNSEISNETNDVIIEAAVFDRKLIRKTTKMHGISTEASMRFERGIDAGGLEYAINKAAHLMQKYGKGKIYSGMIKCQLDKQSPIDTIAIEYDKINKFLGLTLNDEIINTYLKSLGFVVEEGAVLVPSWRHDISIWQDLAEEVGRLYGYNKIEPSPIPKQKAGINKSEYYWIESIKDILCDLGFTEVSTYSFLSEADASAAGLKPSNLIEIKNPVQPENKYLRSSLRPNLIRTIAKNPTFDPVCLFEVGNIFSKNGSETRLGVVASGKRSQEMINSARNKLKEVFTDTPEIIEISREDLSRFKVKKPTVYMIELSLSNISNKFKKSAHNLQISKREVFYRPVSKYPSLTRDIAFIAPVNLKAKELTAYIYSKSPLINFVELFDEFVSNKFGQGKKNMAFHIYLQAQDRTLEEAEANRIIKKIIKDSENQFNIKLRDQ